MNRSNNLLFIFFTLSLVVFSSCSSNKKIGFFNNNYKRYDAAEKNHSNVSSSDNTAASNISEMQSADDKSNDEVNDAITKSSIHPVKSEWKKVSPESISKESKLNREERKAIKKDIKDVLKNSKKNDAGIGLVLLVILAIILPPLAVALVDGITGPFWLSILLTLLFYLPGLIYALFRIFRK